MSPGDEEPEGALAPIVAPHRWAGAKQLVTSWSHASRYRWLIRAAVALGAALRIRNWAADKSLWLDEIQIANNLLTRGFGALTRPLAELQAAPIGWLWAQRLVIDIFGGSELALRLFPLLAAVGGLIAFAFLARCVAGDAVAALATLLFATSPYLIYYAAEVKQYSTDTTAVTIVLAVSVVAAQRQPSAQRMVFWGLACATIAWFSFPAVPVSIACGAVLAARWIRSRRDVAVFCIPGILLGASVVWEYLATLRALGKNTTLNRFWQFVGGYPPPNGGDLHWLRRVTPAVIRNPGGLTWPLLAIALAVVGLVVLTRAQPPVAAIVCAPPAVAIVLALTHHYPLYQRLAVYLVPSLLLLVATGSVALVSAALRIPGAHRGPAWIACAAAAALLVVATGRSVVTGIGKFATPDEITSGREAVQFVADHLQAGDAVLVEYPWAVSNMTFYGRRYGLRATGTFRGRTGCNLDQLRPPGERPRVWIVFAHTGSNEPKDRAEIFLSHFEQQASLTQSYTGAGGAAAYLLNFARPPTHAQPALPMWRRDMCVSVG
ncbi:MAG: hypothetical protein QOG80_3245 [Pseudonocardiales bacterium]|jgi:hypothetical protein|nr:hypothetical protein [Pseudonocardiales bacterium]